MADPEPARNAAANAARHRYRLTRGWCGGAVPYGYAEVHAIPDDPGNARVRPPAKEAGGRAEVAGVDGVGDATADLVDEYTQLSRASWSVHPDFPRPVRPCGSKLARWDITEVDEWTEKLKAERDSDAGIAKAAAASVLGHCRRDWVPWAYARLRSAGVIYPRVRLAFSDTQTQCNARFTAPMRGAQPAIFRGPPGSGPSGAAAPRRR